ncbi:aminotransferase class V-fold PLP-dependent enzyme [Haliangium ochraceum]|uniref:Aminotransferase class V n=1 Tax=Haliangium ochraceum (strain DSM 14365 / JCM 11303 / SMP-2) TaxID=502025 RepID=D0LTK2_HALO1|nr:aminotransferase class V-fold PLP-dependent enzyme [Haliangium ochraceum]ACY13897.1 aminotransferase class V [Haliangium ochraceum DSM 14365]
MIPCQRHLFDLPDEIAYFNCGYMSPLMRSAVAAGIDGITRKAQPWSLQPADFFRDSERARALFARLINAKSDDVAITPAASYGIATAAANLSLAPGERILLLAEQFPANVYSWRRLAQERGGELVTVARPADGDWTGAILARLEPGVRIAALPNCHWTDGGLIDLVRIGERCRAIGCALVLDLTQSLGAMPFDVRAVQPDFVACAAYKWLLGPYSLGFLYVAPHRQDGQPLEQTWIARAGSENFARLIDYQDGYQPGARRFDVGERSNFALMPAAIAGLEQILEWQVERIAATLAATTAAIAARAEAIGLAPMKAEYRASHFLGVRFPEGLPAGLTERLAARQVYVSLRGDCVRITPHLYNHQADIDRLFAVLAELG